MRILLIEDDLQLCRSLGLSLKQQGFSVTVCHDGEEGFYYIQENSHDLVLLDRMLPGMDGVKVLRRARAAHCTVPILLLTALGSLEDRITGLDCGADDYIIKPFAFEELMARIRCICRRPGRLTKNAALSYGDITFDAEQFLLHCGSNLCTLSPREGELLSLFLRNPGQTIPRTSILLRIWGPDSEIETGNLDNYIHFLRRRLKTVSSRLQLITVRAVGYRLSDEQTESANPSKSNTPQRAAGHQN